MPTVVDNLTDGEQKCLNQGVLNSYKMTLIVFAIRL